MGGDIKFPKLPQVGLSSDRRAPVGPKSAAPQPAFPNLHGQCFVIGLHVLRFAVQSCAFDKNDTAPQGLSFDKWALYAVPH